MLPVDEVRQLVESADVVLRVPTFEVAVEFLHLLGRYFLGPALHHFRHVEPRVPEVDVPHRGKIGHRLAVVTHRREHGRAARLVVETAIPSRDLEARRQTLHVPLEWARQRLVEVVHAEDDAPVGRGEAPEVRKVRIAAQLGVKTRARRDCEVSGHQIRAAAEERELRREHAPVADRNELLHARLCLFLEQIDRVAPIRRRVPVGVSRARHLGPLCLAPRHALCGGEVRNDVRLRRRACPLLAFLRCADIGHEAHFVAQSRGHVTGVGTTRQRAAALAFRNAPPSARTCRRPNWMKTSRRDSARAAGIRSGDRRLAGGLQGSQPG
jgi:hypothetical protein